MADQKRNQRMELLNAIASGGTAGGQEYQAAINSAQNGKQVGLQLAAERAGAINAPQAFLQRQNQIISQPLDSAIGLNQANQAATGQYRGSLNAAQGAYMNGVGQSKNLLSQLSAKALGDIQSGAQADAEKQLRTMLSQARADDNARREALNQDRIDAERMNKQNADQLSEEALRTAPTDYRGEDFKALIQENQGLGSALKDLQDNFEGYDDPAIMNEMRDRLLQYYDPQLWLKTSPKAKAIADAPVLGGK